MKRVVVLAALTALAPSLFAQTAQVIRVPLEYRGPVDGQPKPNFSPKGMQITLKSVADSFALPAGAARPAKIGAMLVGPDAKSAIPVLATATAEHPKDLCLLFIDRNRNGNFTDDGAGLPSVPAQNAKTKAWWSSTSKVELSVPYSNTGAAENYFVHFWIVREDEAPAPDIIRFSVGSWRYGTTTINGTPALVAAMDDNNAIWNKDDMWSVIEASAPDAPVKVLSIAEARGTNRMMFVNHGGKESVLEFRGFSPDGRSIDIEIVDKPVTKAEDRKPDDMLAPERSRPRAKVPLEWSHSLAPALARAKAENKLVFIDFETTWCGPCKSMDEWIWTDAEVAAAIADKYVTVKLDGDIEKTIVKKYAVAGYPTMLVIDTAGKEVWRAVGYQSSKEMLDLFARRGAVLSRPTPVSAQGGRAAGPAAPGAEDTRTANGLDVAGKTAEARIIFQRLIDTAPTPLAKAQAQRGMAMSYAFSGDCANTVKYEEMVIAYWRTREIEEPQNAFYQQGEMANEAARVCIDVGQLDVAAEFYRRGTEFGLREPEPKTHPKSLWEYRLTHALARLSARRGNAAEARRYVAEARRILDSDKTMAGPQERFFPYLQGYVDLYLNNLNDALAHLTTAVAIQGNSTDPFQHALIGMTHEKLGQSEQAKAAYQKAYDLATAHNPPAAFARPFAAKKLGK